MSDRLPRRLPAAPAGLTALAALAALAALPGVAGAVPVLTAVEHTLARPPERVAVVSWDGAAAVMVLSRPVGRLADGALPSRRLILLRLRDDGLHEAARWRVPAELRWAEPVRPPGGAEGWLALIGGTWHLGRPRADRLAWRPACECDTVFTVGRAPLRVQRPFAADLDGDGTPEVLLPGWEGLTVYGMTAGGRLQPLWRDAWAVHERFATEDGSLEARFDLPRYELADADGDGIRDLVRIGADRVHVTHHGEPAAPAPGPHYALDGAARTRLKRRQLPLPLLIALEELGDAAFATRGALEAALVEAEPGWAAHLAAAAGAARRPVPVRFGRTARLPQPPQEQGESRRVLAVGDMNGDGVLDVLQRSSTDEGDLFDQVNHIRWYAGRRGDGGLHFAEAPRHFFSEGFAFAELLHTETERPGGAPALLVATMEVSVMAIVKAFTLREVSFAMYVHPWRDGRLLEPAPVRDELDFAVNFGDRHARPMALMADLDGDGRREFLFNLELASLTAFRLPPDGGALAGDRLARVELPRLPDDRDEVHVADLDGDGREEVLLEYRGGPFSPEEERVLRVVRLEDREPESAGDARPGRGGQGRGGR